MAFHKPSGSEERRFASRKAYQAFLRKEARRAKREADGTTLERQTMSNFTPSGTCRATFATRAEKPGMEWRSKGKPARVATYETLPDKRKVTVPAGHRPDKEGPPDNRSVKEWRAWDQAADYVRPNPEYTFPWDRKG